MKKEDFIKRVYLENSITDTGYVDIGADDYGQCYYYEAVIDGQIVEHGCGTYNFDIADVVLYELVPEYKSLFKKQINDEKLTEDDIKRIDEYRVLSSKINNLKMS